MGSETQSFKHLEQRPSFFSRAKALVATLVIVGLVGGGGLFLANEEALTAKLEERGALAVPAAYGLGLRGAKDKARKPLQKGLDRSGNAEPRLRAACAWALGRARARDVVAALDDAARSDPVVAVRVAAVKALGVNGDGLGSRTIQKSLEDGEAAVREAACVAAGDLKDVDLVPYLIPRLLEPAFEIRNAAARALRLTTGLDHGTEPRLWREWWDKR